MSKSIKIILILFLLLLLSSCSGLVSTSNSDENFLIIKNNHMKLTSPNFESNSSIPAKYTCDGEDISPELQIAEVPATAQSLALIVDDPDATNGDWVHWLLWNINPQTQVIAAGQVPAETTQGLTDFGQNKYGGPCPSSGTHHYHFKLYALNISLNLPASSTKKDLETALEEHIIDSTELIGLYERE